MICICKFTNMLHCYTCLCQEDRIEQSQGSAESSDPKAAASRVMRLMKASSWFVSLLFWGLATRAAASTQTDYASVREAVVQAYAATSRRDGTCIGGVADSEWRDIRCHSANQECVWQLIPVATRWCFRRSRRPRTWNRKRPHTSHIQILFPSLLKISMKHTVACETTTGVQCLFVGRAGPLSLRK